MLRSDSRADTAVALLIAISMAVATWWDRSGGERTKTPR